MWTDQFRGDGRALGAMGRLVEVDRLEGYRGHEIVDGTE